MVNRAGWMEQEFMSAYMSVMRMVCVPAIALAVLLMISASGCCQPASQSIESFLMNLPGDWVGTVSQSTDGKFSDTKYCRASTKQLSPDIYETVFTYYRLDAKTGAPVLSGMSGMATKIDAVGVATNSVTGKGDILVEVNRWKPETHELTEVLSICPSGTLQGTGSGSIRVTGMPLGLGKNGKVQGYTSTWSVSNDVLTISQRFTVKFKAFLFSKSFTITAEFTLKRGSDILGLMKSAQPQEPQTLK